jgi:hypothetical protein
MVAAALSWEGARYELGQHLKGVACDCGTFLVECMVEAGKITREEADRFYAEIGYYSHDWFCHTNVQRYLLAMARFGKAIYEGRCYASVRTDPGNIVLTKAVSLTHWTHGGIVVQWPYIMHCNYPAVEKVDASRDPMWANQALTIFDPFAHV